MVRAIYAFRQYQDVEEFDMREEVFKHFMDIRQRLNIYKVKLNKTLVRVKGTLDRHGEVVEADKDFLNNKFDRKLFRPRSKTFADLVNNLQKAQTGY